MFATMGLVCAYLMGGLAVSVLVLGAMTSTAEARGGRGGGRGGWGRGGGRGGWGRGGWGYGGYGYGGGCWRWTPAGWVWFC